MIKLTRLNGSRFTLNAELVESIKETPDTVIKLTTGKNFLVQESEAEIVEKFINYKKKIAYISRDLNVTEMR